MKANRGFRSAWGLYLMLSVVVLAVLGCQSQPAQAPGSSASSEPSKVTVEQVRSWMDRGEALTILDSRSETSWSAATTKASGSLRVPPDSVEPHLAEIPKGQRIIVYCT